MKEQIVPPQIALKLKDLGFDEPCNYQYEKIDNYYEMERTRDLNNNSDYLSRTFKSLYLTSAPTFAEVVDWLYEKHGIWVYVEFGENPNNFFPVIQDLKKRVTNSYKYEVNFWFDSPTEAYEAGIKYVIENLL